MGQRCTLAADVFSLGVRRRAWAGGLLWLHDSARNPS